MSESFISARELKQQGWNEGWIKEYLGKPDHYEQNPSNPGSTLRMFKATRVEAAEAVKVENVTLKSILEQESARRTIEKAKAAKLNLAEEKQTRKAIRAQRAIAEAAEKAEAAELKKARKAMRDAGALMATKTREALGCTKTELYRWRDDSRFPADGFVYCSRHRLDADAWLPATIENAKSKVEEWRRQDATAKIQRRKQRVKAGATK